MFKNCLNFLTFEECIKVCHLVLHLTDQCFKIHKTTLLVLRDTSVKLKCCLPCCRASPVQDDLPDFRLGFCGA